MDKRTKKFLTLFYEGLKMDFWGTIEPEWFDPTFPSDESDEESEESKWAKQLQILVEETLKEV